MDAVHAVGYVRAALAFRRHGVKYEGRPVVIGPRLRIDARGEIIVGSGFMARGRQFPSQLGAAPGGRLCLGESVFVNQGCFLFAAQSVEIGGHARLADLVAIYDTDFHETAPDQRRRVAAVSIGRNVWLGRGAVVLPGVSIGDHAVVGAGSVVARDLPARTVSVGAPARAVSSFRCPDGWVRH